MYVCIDIDKDMDIDIHTYIWGTYPQIIQVKLIVNSRTRKKRIDLLGECLSQ